MANPLKGEARAEVDNVVYTLTFDIETIIAIEHEMKKGWPRVIKDLQNEDTMTYEALRTIVWLSLKPKHPNITKQDASRIIGGLGGPAPALAKLGEAFQASFPDPEPKGENPMQPSQIAATGSGS